MLYRQFVGAILPLTHRPEPLAALGKYRTGHHTVSPATNVHDGFGGGGQTRQTTQGSFWISVQRADTAADKAINAKGRVLSL